MKNRTNWVQGVTGRPRISLAIEALEPRLLLSVGGVLSDVPNVPDTDFLLSSAAMELTYPVVDTGQTAFYNNSVEIGAPSEGGAFYGQDAQFTGNAPSYTLSGNGVTVLDNVTGLTWTQGADWTGDGTVDVSDKFSYADAQTYVDTLNAQDYGGHDDWRVPTIKELYSLIDYRGTDPNPMATSTSGLVPFIDDSIFEFAYGDTSAGERIIDSQWATSTLYVSTVMGNTQAMFGVNFADGRIKGYPAVGGPGGVDKTYYVRFCRGNTDYGTNSFTYNDDATVTDSATGLMWLQADNGAGVNWEDALAWAEQKNDENYLGHNDWRLPNAKELQSLLDYTRSPDTHGTAAIDPLFSATQITNEAGESDYPFYWSGTTFLRFNGSARAAVYVAFGEGLGTMDGTTIIDVHGAGCQRSDPKDGDPDDYPSWGNGPQGDVARVFNYVRLVRDADTEQTNNPPTAEAGGPYSGQPTNTITLDGSASTDTDGSITTYEWDLDNDGQYDDATGMTADFSASSTGTYTVGLQVTDNDGAQDTDTATVTVSEQGTVFDGYNLFSSLNSTTAYLMDNDGNFVHSWDTAYRPGNSMYLLENGELLRTGNVGNTTFNAGGEGGIVQTIDWDGNVTWEYEYSSTMHLQHHDVEMLPNGNVLMVAWQYKTQSEAIAAGRDPSLLTDSELWPDSVIEVQPTGANTGNIVWEWHVWDHLVQDYNSLKSNYGVVADHPELIDLNYAMNGGADWNHINSVDYNAELDQIVLSVHSLSEIWVIDHSTTTAEAASNSGGDSGMGGDLLYRWGNPQTYDAGTAADQQLFHQHDAEWVEDGDPGEGNILIFNNGGGRPGGNYSSIEEITTPVSPDGSYTLDAGLAYGPDQTTWTYTVETPTDFYSQNISGQQRLANGNTLICDGANSYFFEVTASGETVWEYDYTGAVFRVERYAPEYSGFDGTPLDDEPSNQAPVADAGGLYSGEQGSTITLNGLGSTDTDGSIVLYEWDLDNDGQYDDATGATTGFVTTTAGTFTVGLRVTDDDDAQDMDTAVIDVTALPVVTIVATDAGASETGPNNGTFTITRTGSTNGTLSVSLSVGGTAAPVADYGQLSNTIVIPSGHSSVNVTVTPVDDNMIESAETVTLEIQNNSEYTVGVSHSATVTIADNDVANVAPTAHAQSPEMAEDGIPIAILLTGEDDETPANQLVAVNITDPAHGEIAINGNTVTYTPDSNYNGPDSFTFRMRDTGLNGGDELESAPATVSITVDPVNDEPSFVKGANQTLNEDAGAQTVAGWATDISTGPADESGQTLTFAVTNDNNDLFSQQPTISPDGTLTYTPAPDANGTTTVTAILTDNGGTANGGDDESDPQTFTITVGPVNDAPSFLKGADQEVDEDSGTQTVAGWATDISAGPADESGQALTFAVTNDNNDLFSQQPLISSDGTLTYTPAPDANGSATVTVILTDNGGKANGGDDASAQQTFTITVNPVNDRPVAIAPSSPAIAGNQPSIDIILNGDDLETNAGDLVYAITTWPTQGTVVINGNTATYTPDPGWDGLDSFWFAATDTGDPAGTPGNVLTSDPVKVDIQQGTDIAITAGTKSVTYRESNDAGGAAVSIRLNRITGSIFFPFEATWTDNGRGTITVTPVGDDFGAPRIDVATSTSRSSIRISTRSGDNAADLAGITGEMEIGSLTGRTISLTGDGIQMTDGFIGRVMLSDILGGADIFMPGIGATRGLSLQVGQVGEGTVMEFGSGLSRFSAVSIADTVTFEAPYALSIRVKGDRRANIAGDMGGVFNLTGKDARRGTAFNSIRATGEITSDIELLVGSGGTITGGSWTAGSFKGTFLKSITLNGNRTAGKLGDFGAAIDLTGNDGRGMSLNTLRATGTITSQINLAAGANSISAGRWDGGGLNAAMVKTLSIKGERRSGLQGDLANAAFNLTGVINLWGNRSAFGNLKVANDINNAIINANGDVKSLMAATINDSQVFLGYDEGVGVWGTGAFASSCTISTLRLFGIRGEDTSCFTSSTIAAATIKNGSIAKMDGVNDGDSFGFIIDDPASKISVKEPRWTWVAPEVAPGETAEDGFEDFLVRDL